MTDIQTFAAVFVLQKFSTKFKILKKNHFKQKCNGFVTVEIHTFHSWKSCIKCCRQVHQQHQIRIGSGLIVDVRPNLDCHSSPQVCWYLIFTRWFIAVADFWLVIFLLVNPERGFYSWLSLPKFRLNLAWTFFFSPHKKIFEYIHDKPLIYHLNNLTDNVLQKCFLVVYVVRYTDIFWL